MIRPGLTLRILVIVAAASGAAAYAEDELPPLFAARPAPRNVESRSPAALPTSPHIRSRIKSLTQAISAPPPLLARTPRPSSADPVSMEPYIVEEKPLRLKVSPPPNRFLDAVRSGHLWTFAEGKELVSFGESTRAGHGRITLGFRFAF